MTLILGKKKDGKFYLGADSLATFSDCKQNIYDKEEYKIRKIGDLIIGGSGHVSVIKRICLEDELFTLPKSGLTKELVAEVFVPAILKIVKDEDLADELNPDELNIGCSFAFAWKDKCIILRSNLLVWEVADRFAMGSGTDYAFPVMYTEDFENVNESLLKALRAGSNLCTSVGAPYILIDTEKQQYEIVEK
ncbi:MAG: hypothetical protein IJS93_01635 [Clostridia bacterium]|nr:hypothetical protein [Clostridia bacterium]